MQWQKFFEAVNNKLRNSRMPYDIKAKKKCENEVMLCLLADPDVRRLMSLWLNEQHKTKEGKSLEKTKQLRELGNKEFQAKNYSASIHLYTKSLQYAPMGSEDLALAVANRSASLFYLEKFEDCIKDIDLAVMWEYPENLRYKLHLRAAQCFWKLRKRKSMEESLMRVQDIVNNCEEIPEIKKTSIKQQVTSLMATASSMEYDDENEASDSMSGNKPEPAFGVNSNFPYASAALEKKCAPDKGRYVVANRDIHKGQILFVEKPFAFVLLDHEQSSSLCAHCCRPQGDVPFPCKMCVEAMYCDVKCQDDAWTTYHQWECPGSRMGVWQQIGIAHLAMKLLLNCATTQDVDKFNQVQSLVTNIDKLMPEDLIVYGITATMLTLYLYKYTDFFKVVDINESFVRKFADSSLSFECDLTIEDGKRLYISSLLLRHMLQLICNGHAITRLNLTASDKDKVSTEHQDRVATGIYLSASMMNHACDPNIINSFWDQHLIVKATKDIGVGEEVLNCYGPHFRRMSKDDRQETLKNQYCFICKCEACTNPELRYFLERFSALKCPECTGALHNLHSYSLHCLDCGATPIVTYGADLKEAQDLYDAAQGCIDHEKIDEALYKLKQCLCIRRNVLYKHHEDIAVTLDLIGKVYAIMGRWLDSISYLEHSIAAVEERFGPDSVELANELNKITDICIQYLREETNTSTKQYKNTLKKTRRFLDRAEQIMNLNYGPWNDSCREIMEKKEKLSVLLKDFNV
ncbi:SET and MYND domain-containing protein 4-like [Leptopilina boulardi]|uniref:SET and MYND domain-containing protein 4-like n=1 Tax=Leptopilina boulardi TaxID=63433 RepID=UPI0021F50308|nr:SET and MYND domain-containing protein 4-like [Leptopilina boulardi]